MNEQARDAQVSGAYRALGRDEPPAALDVSILAASRRHRSRWAVPVSVAAVVVLAVGVTLRGQLEQPKTVDEVVLAPKVMQAPQAGKVAPVQESAAPAPAQQPALRKRAAPAAPAAANSFSADAAAPAGRMASGLISGKADEKSLTPEQWLERIARLREAGQARAADDGLAAFRKRYPDFRLSEAMRARVAPR